MYPVCATRHSAPNSPDTVAGSAAAQGDLSTSLGRSASMDNGLADAGSSSTGKIELERKPGPLDKFFAGLGRLAGSRAKVSRRKSDEPHSPRVAVALLDKERLRLEKEHVAAERAFRAYVSRTAVSTGTKRDPGKYERLQARVQAAQAAIDAFRERQAPAQSEAGPPNPFRLLPAGRGPEDSAISYR